MAKRPKHPPVLLYHSIAELGETLEAGACAFRAQMEHLARAGYRSLTPNEFLQGLDTGEWPRRAVFITFDDGYLDFHDVAWPVLREFGLNATVFLVHDGLEGGIQAWTGPTYPVMPPLLSWAEVLEMQGKGVYFGSHTLSHPELTKAGMEVLTAEIAGSKRALEERLGEEVALFSYPYGGAPPAAPQAVQDAGYRAAFGVAPAAPTRFELFRRIVKPARTLVPFRLRVSRAYEPLRCILHVSRGEKC